MRIGIGALVGIVGGPATYARELVAALARLGGHEYVVFTDRPEHFADVDVERVVVPLATIYHQVAWDHVRLPGLLATSSPCTTWRSTHAPRRSPGHSAPISG